MGEHADDDIAAQGGGNPGTSGGRPATRDGFSGRATRDDEKELVPDENRDKQEPEKEKNIMGG